MVSAEADTNLLSARWPSGLLSPVLLWEDKVFSRTWTKPKQPNFSCLALISLLTKFLTQGSHLHLTGLVAQINDDIWQLELETLKEGPGSKTPLGNYTLTI